MNNVHVIDHPLVSHKLTQMRKKETPSSLFRELTTELSTILAYEVSRDFELKNVRIETPLQESIEPELVEKDVVLIPILRAGLGMVEGFSHLLPNAKIGHIGIYRDPETKEAVEYFLKLPDDIKSRESIIIDPMNATGHSAVAAIDAVKKHTEKPIKLVNILAAPEGIAYVREKHPDVEIYCAAIDEKLDENKYILPGLGDAGDRLFGTKGHQ